MAKFCGKCGTQLDDTAKVCGNCGTPLDGAAEAKVNDAEYEDPAKKEQNKKIGKLVVIGAAALVVLIIFINIISGFTGYKGEVRKVMKAYKNYDAAELADLSSEYSELNLMYYMYSDLEKYYENKLDNDFDLFDDEVGNKYKIKYEILDKKTGSDRKLDDLTEELSELSGFDVDISKMMSVEVEITAKHGRDDVTVRRTLVLTKENGSWYLYDIM